MKVDNKVFSAGLMFLLGTLQSKCSNPELFFDYYISLIFVTFRSYMMQMHEMDILPLVCLLVAGFGNFEKIIRNKNI